MSYKPKRINRGTYLNSNAAASMLCLVVVALGYVLDIVIIHTLLFTYIALSLVAIFIIIYGTILSIGRLHDTNKNGWWLLLWIVPYADFYLVYVLFFKKSDVERNKYGETPEGVYVMGMNKGFFSRNAKDSSSTELNHKLTIIFESGETARIQHDQAYRVIDESDLPLEEKQQILDNFKVALKQKP
jgi:uncharacterized membrane protein YhaH (DUF805 family)